MKVFVYGYRKEEAAYFSACAKAMQLEIGTCAQRPTLENAQLCQGYECISVLSTDRCCIAAEIAGGRCPLSVNTYCRL